MIELLNMDCMDYLKDCKDNEFDLAIVDPPYGLGESGSGRISRNRFSCVEYMAKDWDNQPPPAEYFQELIRVSKHQIIWGANHFIELVPAANSSSWIVWDKENGESNFADSELAWTSHSTAVRNFRYRWAGMLQGNMKNKEQRIHPTQKPVPLYDWLLSKYAEPNMKVLDTHLGSGSSAIASHYFGCDFVGIELDKDYFEAAQKRFEQQTAQLDMF